MLLFFFFDKCVTSILDLHVLSFHSGLAMLQKSAKTVFHGELHEGKRSQGSQTKRYKDTFKASFKDFNIPTDFCEQATQDRTKWR